MNNNKQKYLSNNPVIDERYNEGVDALQQMVYSPDVYNIGVIAPYGAGKSSLIKSYLDHNKKLKMNKKKIASVSFINLSEEKEGENKQSNYEEDYEDKNNLVTINKNMLLEKSILEQLLFRETPSKLPLSKIEKIHNSIIRYILISVSFLLTISSFLITYLYFKEENGFLRKIPLALILFSDVLLPTLTLVLSMIFFKISKLAIKNIEIDFNDIKKGSVLNLFLDEIIYFFAKTKKDVVIFEDIDRFKTVEIFTKLREINSVLNNNIRVNRKITFIYCVSDDLFISEGDRAKFFDFALSIVPIYNLKNASKHISSCFSDKTMEPDNIFESKIARFITDKRVLNNIINDYIYYYKTIENRDKNKLFAMMVYKNIYCKDYVDLINGKGDLFDLFNSKKNDLVKIASLGLKKSIEETNLIIEKANINENVIESFNELKNMVIGLLFQKGQNVQSVPNGYVDIMSLATFKDVNTGLYLQNLNSRNVYGYVTYKQMSIVDIEKELKKGLYEKEELIKGDLLKKLIDLRKNNEKKLVKINGMSLRGLLSEYNLTEDIKNIFEEKKFLHFAIKNGYIDESYYMFLGQDDSKIDSDFVYNVTADIETDPMVKLNNCESIIEDLSADEFCNKYIFNYSLVETLFSKNIDAEKESNLINYLAIRDSETKRFVANYVSLNYCLTGFINKLFLKNEMILSDILSDNNIDEYSKILVLKALKSELDSLSSDDNKISIRNYINDVNTPLHYLLEIFNTPEYAIDFMKVNQINRLSKIEFSDDAEEDIEKLFILIINENYFAINKNNIDLVIKYYVKEKEYSISSLLSNEHIRDYMNNNLNEIVDLMCHLSASLHESQDIKELVLTGDNVKLETKELFIKHIADDIEFIPNLDKQLYDILLTENKIVNKWNLLEELFKIPDMNVDSICLFVVNNCDKMRGEIKDPNFASLLINKFSKRNEIIKYVLDASLMNVYKDIVLDINGLLIVLQQDDYESKVIVQIVINHAEVIKNSISNQQLCDLLLRLFMNVEKCILEDTLVDCIIENASFELLNEETAKTVFLKILDNGNLLHYIKRIDKTLYEDLFMKKDNLEVKVASSYFNSSNTCMMALLDKELIKQIGKKGKNYTKVNIDKARNLIE